MENRIEIHEIRIEELEHVFGGTMADDEPVEKPTSGWGVDL